MYSEYGPNSAKKKKKLADKILPQKVRDLVPESQAYMDLLAFERKLDATIMRKCLDIQVSKTIEVFKTSTLKVFLFKGSIEKTDETKAKITYFHLQHVLSS